MDSPPPQRDTHELLHGNTALSWLALTLPANIQNRDHIALGLKRIVRQSATPALRCFQVRPWNVKPGDEPSAFWGWEGGEMRSMDGGEARRAISNILGVADEAAHI